MKIRVISGFVLVFALFGVFVSGQASVDAQGIPSMGFALYQGSVTVAGQPAEDGLEIRARVVGTSWESRVVTTSGGRYIALEVGPVEGAEGNHLEFILENQIVATTHDTYYAPDCGAVSCPASAVFNLTFSTIPLEPTPTPSLPARYSGYVSTGDVTLPDRTPLTIRIGHYESSGGTVSGGEFSIIVDPQDMSLAGVPIEFFLAGIKSVQTVAYQPGEIVSNVILTFAALPTPTPVPTSTPVPTPIPTATSVPIPTQIPEATATPEPTRTPTPAPTSTPVPTATPTPTPMPVTPSTVVTISEPTATPGVMVAEEVVVVDEDEGGGGLCSANPGGPASGGQIGLLLAPLALGFWVRARRKTAQASID